MLRKSELKYYFLAFALSVVTGALFIIPFTLRGGGIFYLGSDFVEQQIPFLTYMNAALKSAHTAWSQANDLGTSFVGAYSFYGLGSPFFWISLAIPAKYIYKFAGALLLLKMGVCSLTTFIYIKRYVKEYQWAVIGGILYTFCGYQISNMNFHFYDITALFPLLLIGLDMSFYDDKKGVFPICVAVCALTNYVFFPGECIFLFIYLTAKLLTKEYSLTLKKFIQMAFESIIGVGISCILLVPSVLQLLSNPRVEGASFEGIASMVLLKPIYWAEIIRSSLFPAECIFDRGFFLQGFTNGAELYIPLFGIVLVVAYVRKKRRDWITLLLGICRIFAVIPLLNSSFVLFNPEYYTRWYNMPILVGIIACRRVLEDRELDLKPGFIAYGILWVLLGVVFVSFTFFFKVTFIYNMVPVVVYVVISVTGFVFTYFLRKIQDMKFGAVILTALVMVYSARGGAINSYYHERGREPEAVNNYYTADRQIDTSQFSTMYRISSRYYFMNLGTILKQPTVSTFSSNIRGSSFDFYSAVGIPRTVITSIPYSEYVLRSFLSAKYWIELENCEDEINPDYFETNEYQGRYMVRDYRYALPMGFCFDKYITEEEYNKLSTEERRENLLKCVVLEEIPESVDFLEEVSAEDILNDAQSLEEQYELRSENACRKFEYTMTGFTAQIKNEGKQLVFFSVPYDRGWTAYINEEPAEIIKADYGFMAVLTEPGRSDITFVYSDPGKILGMLITTFSLITYVSYCVIIWMKENDEEEK